MDRSRAHQELLAELRLKCGNEPDVLLLVNPRGFDRICKVEYGLCPGAADLIGIGPGGRFVGCEVKTGKAKQTEEQLRFERLVKRYNGIYVVARSVDDLWKQIKEMRKDG
jgi:hypothetical protein